MKKSGMKFELNEYTPFGFVQSVGFPEVLRLYEEHVVLVRKIFELCVKGWSLGQITEYVNSTDISYRAKYEKDMKVMWSELKSKRFCKMTFM